MVIKPTVCFITVKTELVEKWYFFEKSFRMNSELWQRIRYARRAKGLTQEDIARRLGIAGAAVTRWESAKAVKRNTPSLENFPKLAEILGVSLEWLRDDSVKLAPQSGYEFEAKPPPPELYAEFLIASAKLEAATKALAAFSESLRKATAGDH